MSNINLENTIIPSYGRTQHLLAMLLNDSFKKHDIDLNREQWILLHKLHGHDGMHQNILAEMINRDKTSLTRLISKMESKNLVKRIVDPQDRRANKIYFTKKGMEIYESSLPVMIEIAKNIEQNISKTDLRKVMIVSKSIQDNITKQLNN